MPAGMQIYDITNRLIVDTSTLLPRSVYIGFVTDSGSATIVPVAQGVSVGVPLVLTQNNSAPPEVSINNTTGVLTWNRRNGKEFYTDLYVVLL